MLDAVRTIRHVMVPEATDVLPTPWQTDILAPRKKNGSLDRNQ
jgi:hypothetical protein